MRFRDMVAGIFKNGLKLPSWI